MRWPWTQKGLTEEAEELRAKIRSLSDELHEVKRDFRSIQMEWDGQYSKYQTLYARLAKQAKRLERDLQTDPGETNGHPVGVELAPAPNLARRFRRW